MLFYSQRTTKYKLKNCCFLIKFSQFSQSLHIIVDTVYYFQGEKNYSRQTNSQYNLMAHINDNSMISNYCSSSK